MKISPLVLLLFAPLGYGSGTDPATTPAKADGNQAQPQKVASPEKQSAKTPAEKATTEESSTEKPTAENSNSS